MQNVSNAVSEHLCDISHGFNWHNASCGPLAIAELLVGVTVLAMLVMQIDEMLLH